MERLELTFEWQREGSFVQKDAGKSRRVDARARLGEVGL